MCAVEKGILCSYLHVRNFMSFDKLMTGIQSKSSMVEQSMKHSSALLDFKFPS